MILHGMGVLHGFHNEIIVRLVFFCENIDKTLEIRLHLEKKFFFLFIKFLVFESLFYTMELLESRSYSTGKYKLSLEPVKFSDLIDMKIYTVVVNK